MRPPSAAGGAIGNRMHPLTRVVAWTALPLACALGCCGDAAAEELSGTLKKIKESGSVTLAVRDASSPFSFLDENQEYVGYGIDICMKIVDALKVELGQPGLKVRMTPVNAQSRIPLVANGTVDLECASTSNTVERQHRAAFLVTTFVSGTRLLVKKTSNIRSYRDLKGKTVVVTNGTTDERVLKELDAKENLGLNFIQAQEHSEGFLNVESGHAVAFPLSAILLDAIKANANNPAEYEVVGDYLSDDALAIMIRKDDPGLKKLGDRVIIGLMKNGELERIYRKWFESPIPPKGINLRVPMSAALKRLFESPNDQGSGACNRFQC
jgi:glutamate/aspartate transport system substrate-binding protein